MGLVVTSMELLTGDGSGEVGVGGGDAHGSGKGSRPRVSGVMAMRCHAESVRPWRAEGMISLRESAMTFKMLMAVVRGGCFFGFDVVFFLFDVLPAEIGDASATSSTAASSTSVAAGFLDVSFEGSSRIEAGTSSTQYARLRMPMSMLRIRSGFRGAEIFKDFCNDVSGKRGIARRCGRRSTSWVLLALLSRPARKARWRTSVALRESRSWRAVVIAMSGFYLIGNVAMI